MARNASTLRDVERWLQETAEEAELLLPGLLDLSRPALRRELRVRPELRTPRMLQALMRAALDVLDRAPSRAHELTVVVARYAPLMVQPPGFEEGARIIRGEAWREYANALRENGRAVPAQRAIRAARSLFSPVAGSGWYLATVDLVDGSLLHDLGFHDLALDCVRRAARQFAVFRDDAGFIKARLLEVWMLREAGATRLWTATAAIAERHPNAPWKKLSC